MVWEPARSRYQRYVAFVFIGEKPFYDNSWGLAVGR